MEADYLLQMSCRRHPLLRAKSMNVLSIKQTCAILGVSRSTAHRLVRDGKLTTIRLSARRVGIRESDLAAFVGVSA
jgi:excisionase family DNA binding protein